MRLREVGNPDDEKLVQATIRDAKPFEDTADLRPLVNKLAEARVVMLGEASHGTHEFYDWRTKISRELIEHHGFRFIAVEGDWPPCWQLNNFVHGKEGDAHTALQHFRRWPTWMWANSEALELAEWMRSFNEQAPPDKKVGFYGMDVYSLFESIEAATEQLNKISPFLAKKMKTRFACFEPFQRDEKAYARSLLHFPAGCHDEVARNLKEILEHRLEEGPPGNAPFGDALFDAQQNTRIVANAENYYRTMVHGNEDSWNVRDRHMFETLGILLDRYGTHSKGIVWAHNTHIGDYRATDMVLQGQINIGGLVREAMGEKNVALVGFGTYEGDVIASHAWDGPIERMPVPKGKPGSIEAAFHKASAALGERAFYLDLNTKQAKLGPFSDMRGHRAIGVVYQPKFEAFGNYVPTSLSGRYDAFLFFDHSTALDPLAQEFDRREFPETWPLGM
ncbi:MAG: erythromycin esterase family protein [Bdellovibrionota bacterium]